MRTICSLILILLTANIAMAQPPGDLHPKTELVQPGVKLTLVAEHPSIVTPTGLDVDETGRLWAVASHTHFRPEEYEGPEHDQVLVFQNDNDKTPRVFLEQTTATMDLELGPGGWVYLAERDRILRVKDTDSDGAGDLVEELATLETEADYPHNGLSGLAWHPSGDLVFALGENFWRPWQLTGTDGVVIEGTGEGGVFRCRPNGSRLHRVARGFWNPFGICVRSDGTVFAAENDPGARPPCRLLHVVEGGDYGYQRLYGSSPYHPFVCWDGELRGTLPMLHPVGEAPCGIAALGNGLIVPSWTEHRIDFYSLSPTGAGFQAKRFTLVRGGQHFRPTCITRANPTTFYLTDWVFGSYQLHQRGRIWKLQIDPEASWLGDLELTQQTDEAKHAHELISGAIDPPISELLATAKDVDPYMRHAAQMALAARSHSFRQSDLSERSLEDQIALLLALRRGQPDNEQWVRYFWNVPDPEIRFETLRWIADHHLVEFREDVRALLRDPHEPFDGYRIFEAALATWNALTDNPQAGVADATMLIERVRDREASPRSRSFALRLLEPNHKGFGERLWNDLMATKDPQLFTELVRAVALSEKPEAKSFLKSIAADENQPVGDRANAIAGLRATDLETVDLLIQLASSEDRPVREEALRSIRFTELDEKQKQRLNKLSQAYPGSSDLITAALDPAGVKVNRPPVAALETWQRRLSLVQEPIDIEAGRRIFHHASVGTCAKCHRHSGRGNVVGPDLTAASNEGDRDRLLRSLLQPSNEIDPQFYPRLLMTDDGRIFTGLLLRDGGGGREVYRDSSGRERVFETAKIVERKELTTSMMPEGLIDLMTDREIRDLLAFLDTHRKSGQTQKDRQEL
ncbi:MAG: PVC-type heme-binding CxxCH protein [Planctomycetota bacterium]